jgi:hypothetical protein
MVKEADFRSRNDNSIDESWAIFVSFPFTLDIPRLSQDAFEMIRP